MRHSIQQLSPRGVEIWWWIKARCIRQPMPNELLNTAHWFSGCIEPRYEQWPYLWRLITMVRTQQSLGSTWEVKLSCSCYLYITWQHNTHVYLPYDKKDNEEEYLDRLTKLYNLVAECDSTCITVVGDYNANVQKYANFAMLLKGFCDQFKYIWTSYNKLPKDTYTYVSDAWGSHSWLDHSISTEDGNNMITNMKVLYGSVQSDHIPVAIEIDLHLAPDVEHGAANSIRDNIDWSAVSEEVFLNYRVQTDILLNNIVQPTDAMSCKDGNCTKVDHKEALHKYYDDIMTAIRCAGQNTMKMRNQHKGNNFNLPGWKEFASDLYSMSRDLYFMWKDSGSPRQGELFNMKNRAKAPFKGTMRFIRCNEDALRKDSLAKKNCCVKMIRFFGRKSSWWITVSYLFLMSLMEWLDRTTLLTCGNPTMRIYLIVSQKIQKRMAYQNVEYDLNVEVSHPEVTNAIKELSDNKSCGLDGIHAAHVKHCSDILIPLLSKCFTGLLVHGTLPESMIDVVLVPIVKNNVLAYAAKQTTDPLL